DYHTTVCEPVHSPSVNSQAKSMIYQETVRVRGVPVQLDAVRVENQTFIISGKVVKTAGLPGGKDEWLEDIQNPEEVIRVLKNVSVRIDLLRFWQRIPETEPKFGYYKEWRHVAAIPISGYDHW